MENELDNQIEGEELPQEEIETPEETQVPPEEPEDSPSEDELPSDPEKQREAFISMRQELKEYKRRLEDQEDGINLVNLARGIVPESPEPQTQPVQQDTQTDFAEAIAETRRLSLEAKAQFEDMEAWSEFPQLRKGKDGYDRTFAQDVAQALVADAVRAQYEKRPRKTLVEAAREVDKRYQQIIDRAKQDGYTQGATTMTQKIAASQEARGTRQPNEVEGTKEQIERLRERVRRGDQNAFIELEKLRSQLS